MPALVGDMAYVSGPQVETWLDGVEQAGLADTRGTDKGSDPLVEELLQFMDTLSQHNAGHVYPVANRPVLVEWLRVAEIALVRHDDRLQILGFGSYQESVQLPEVGIGFGAREDDGDLIYVADNRVLSAAKASPCEARATRQDLLDDARVVVTYKNTDTISHRDHILQNVAPYSRYSLRPGRAGRELELLLQVAAECAMKDLRACVHGIDTAYTAEHDTFDDHGRISTAVPPGKGYSYAE